MTAPATTFDSTPDDAPQMVTLGATRSIPAGWRVIGSREFTEHLLSVRFIALRSASISLRVRTPRRRKKKKLRQVSATPTATPRATSWVCVSAAPMISAPPRK